MDKYQFGVVESRFADLVWQNAPMTTRHLVELCEKELNWARTTTYTVLKKMCQRGLFDMRDAKVTVLITKDEFKTLSSQQFVDTTFGGSLPAFIAAFTSKKNISQKDLAQIREIIDAMEET